MFWIHSRFESASYPWKWQQRLMGIIVLSPTCQSDEQNMISEKQSWNNYTKHKPIRLLHYWLDSMCFWVTKHEDTFEMWILSRVYYSQGKTLLSEFGKQIEVEQRKIKNTKMRLWKYIHSPAVLHWTCVLLLQPRAKNECSCGGCWMGDSDFFNYSLTYFGAQSLTTDLM